MCGAFLSYADYTEGDTRRNGPMQDQILCSKSSSAEDLKGKNNMSFKKFIQHNSFKDLSGLEA
jgi:hypothetical protein